ncbi:MAG: alanine--tRNA ligase [Methanosarcinaceae archaeon]|nr:alanine--tRNA ligase [Methanosarcinaceae archaeon]
MLEDEYNISYFDENGYIKKTCSECGNIFLTKDPDRTTCGDAPCDPYTFIGSPKFDREFTVPEMRSYYLDFFEQRGHTPVHRYPVAARWRDDIYLTIASIADFQPYVTSGRVAPPANPLTISQPCIRLNDLDSVGRTGRHLTTFEMMAHHVFNNSKREYYWKDETVRLCDELLKSLGVDEKDVTYIQNPWAGGGNAGASVEVMVGGLELATLVFMNLKETKTGSVNVNGKLYDKMETYIVDTGYGLERFVWASQGTPTIYDAIFPSIIEELTNIAGIDHHISDPEYREIFAQNAKFSGLMDVSGSANIYALRKQVAESIGKDVDELTKIMEPMEKIYAIADHTRCLTFMLGDGIIPSNVKAGYLARLVLRRTLRLLNDLNVNVPLSELVALHIKNMPEYPEFAENFHTIEEILASEEDKYGKTMEKGARIVERSAKKYAGKGPIPQEELLELYDSHGITPEITKDIAEKAGVAVDLPDNFYSLVAEMHSEAEEKETEGFKYEDKILHLPATKKMYYAEPERMDFEAVVLDVFDNLVVLDSTFFYPESGGQEADHGTLTIGNYTYNVSDVQIHNGVIVHEVDSEKYGVPINKGDLVSGVVNKARRDALTRHHTATHIINDAAKRVLGNHIWQAGAQKTEERARLDVSHFKHVTQEELNEIELIANKIVMSNKKLGFEVLDRTTAEQTYGFELYQGGVPKDSDLRIVKVGTDIEACGGTHCSYTGDVGMIKILGCERIQDGVVRFEYAAGDAAIRAVQHTERLLAESSDILSVTKEKLPETVDRFFREWKELNKENSHLKDILAELKIDQMIESGEVVNGIKIITDVGKYSADELRKMAVECLKYENSVSILLGEDNGVKIVASCGKLAIERGIKAGDLVREMSKIVGGGGGGKPDLALGGGPDVSKINDAKEAGIELVKRMANE